MISATALVLLSVIGTGVIGTGVIGTGVIGTGVIGTGVMGTEEFDPNTVTPGVIGFIITFGIAAVTVLLLIDMNRRIRRTRYRGEIREQLDAEETEAAAMTDTEEPPSQEPDEPPRA